MFLALTNNLSQIESDVGDVVTAGERIFDMVMPLIIACVGLTVLLFFTNKIYNAREKSIARNNRVESISKRENHRNW